MVNCVSQLLAGYLIDKISFNKLMPACGALLPLNLVSIYFVGQHFLGILICVWLVYLLAFAQFSTIPSQAKFQ